MIAPFESFAFDRDASNVVTVEAPAKINLYLHVIGRRSDGYHELDSLVMFADIADRIEVCPLADEAAGFPLTIEGAFAAALAQEPSADNLVTRAARKWVERIWPQALSLNGAAVAKRFPASAIRLIKELPIASGIGGGSADAAACLRALNRLWVASDVVGALSPELLALAAQLGADVPVCLVGKPAYFGGIGEIIDPAPALPECPCVLVNPGVPLSTPAVFRARSGAFSGSARLENAPVDVAAFAAALSLRRNDLTSAAISVVPAVAEVLAALEASPRRLLSRLSGSGATCFGLYPDFEAACIAARELSAEHPLWWVRAGRLRQS
ncbi:4-diphosphocytidyl-2-C-methyl-D-erythritol kinase [Azospirillaceae bacterium]